LGYWTDDLFDGGAGNDLIKGYGGADTYIFGRGSGQDVIEESIDTIYEDYPDTIQFSSNVMLADVYFSIVGSDLLITIAGVTDTLTIKNHFGSSNNAVEFFRFADNTVLTNANVAVLAVEAQSTFGDDTITGTSGSDTIDGLAGNDTLQGLAGDDIYVFGRGSGQDVVNDDGNSGSKSVDKITFKVGVVTTNLQFSRTGNDLIIKTPVRPTN